MHGPWCITGEERGQLWGFSLFTILFNHQLCTECLFYISHLAIGEAKSLFHLGGYSYTRRMSKVDEQALTDFSSRTWERSGLMAVAISTIHWWDGMGRSVTSDSVWVTMNWPFPFHLCTISSPLGIKNVSLNQDQLLLQVQKNSQIRKQRMMVQRNFIFLWSSCRTSQRSSCPWKL